jgi:putative ABC transport system permease protein
MKTFLKFLSRNKLYTAIEAVGLAVSLAFVLIIGT